MSVTKKAISRVFIGGLTALVGAGLSIACESENTPPVADVGEVSTSYVGFPVQFDGSASSDADGDELAYTWRLVAKPERSDAALSDTSIAKSTVTPDRVGSYVVGLVVNDGSSYSASADRQLVAQPWFSDVTKETEVSGIGITEKFITFSSDPMAGAAWGDYDEDGDQDLYVALAEVRPRARTSDHLYRNNGDTAFTDVGVEAGVAVTAMRYVTWGDATRGVIWGDYDGDGDLDLYAVNSGNRERWDEPNALYRNNGDGTFTNVAEAAGVADKRFGMGAAWGDYDDDGDLDLAIANHGRIVETDEKKIDWYNEAAAIYRNNGDGTFTDVAPQLGMGQDPIMPKSEWDPGTVRCGSPWQPFWFDYDGDADLDIFFTCEDDTGTNLLYRNNGDGTFAEVTEDAGLWGSTGHGIDAGDYDNDGDLDLYVTDADSNHLWRNNGNGTFTDVASAAGVEGRGGVGWGTAFFDFDNDGDLDIYVAAGDWTTYGSVSERETYGVNLLYRNRGDGTFEDVSDVSGLGLTSLSRGLALADYDGDGDMDIFLTSSDDKNYLFRNDIANYLDNNWLKIRLVGTTSNTSGIGAVVKVTAGDLVRVEQLFGGGSFLSQDALELHFGLAGESSIDTIEVVWPSGIVQVIPDVEPNQTITIREAQADG